MSSFGQLAPMADSEYLLGASKLANARLNLQHFLVTHHFDGQLLDKHIPSTQPGLKIADVGCGTGIWMTSLRLHESTEISGFDIDLANLPSPSFLKGIHCSVWNMFEPPPPKYQKCFDIVNMQLALVIVNDEKIALALENILMLLKPGGWLQWTEMDAGHQKICYPKENMNTQYVDKLIPGAWGLYDMSPPAWPAKLDTVFAEHKLEEVMRIEPDVDLRMLRMWTEAWFMGANETLLTFLKLMDSLSEKVKEKARSYQDVTDRAWTEFAETRAGIWLPIIRYIGRKPSN